jgi:hypothetical protein
MKLVRSLIGVFVANKRSATECFYNFSPQLQGALHPDRLRSLAIRDRVTVTWMPLFSHRLLGFVPDAVVPSRSPRVG